jgi:predicted dehydrogenase
LPSTTNLKRLPIAIVGLNFGQHIIFQLQREPARSLFKIVAVCDLDRARTNKKAKELKVKAYYDLDNLLSDPEIPAVGLFTGPIGRADLLRKIIRSGKDVMTTKPFEVDPKAAAAVLKEAKRLGRVIHLNSPAPIPSQDLAQIARWRQEFDLGRPIGARADAWASYREVADGSWYDNPDRCPVAPIFRLGIYLVNDLIDLFGPVEAVQVFRSRIFTKRPTPDNGQLALRFKNGALANIFSSFCIDDGQFYRNALTLNFERGTIYRNQPPSIQTPANYNICDLMLVTQKRKKAIVLRKKHLELSGAYQWQTFYRAISNRGRKKFAHVLPSNQIIESLKVILAMSRSEKSGRTEKI